MKTMKPEHVKAIIVHCSATPPEYDCGVKEIDRWHRKRGWMMCGYHFIVRRSGEVETGRELTRFGAHCPGGWNQKSIGICMIGGTDKKPTPKRKPKAETNFTIAQYEALDTLICDLRLNGYKHCAILGHRDTPPGIKAKKDCPSFDAPKWWESCKIKFGGTIYGSAYRVKDCHEGRV